MWNRIRRQMGIKAAHRLLPFCCGFLLIWLTANAQQPAKMPRAGGDADLKTAVATPKETPPPVVKSGFSTSLDDHYKIGPGDVLDIRILNRPNLSREAVRVEGNGAIRMPLIDTDIQAACLTESELAKEIAKRYLKF